MGGKRMKQAKKCKECGKVLRERNASGLCRYHYIIEFKRKLREKRKKDRICIDCGKKVEPIYPTRCSACRIRKNSYGKKGEVKKQLKKEVVTTIK